MKNKKRGYLAGVLVLTLAAGIGIAVKARAAATRTVDMAVAGPPQGETTNSATGPGGAVDPTYSLIVVNDTAGGLKIYRSDGVTEVMEVTDNLVRFHVPVEYTAGTGVGIPCTPPRMIMTYKGRVWCGPGGFYRGPWGEVPPGLREPADPAAPTNIGGGSTTAPAVTIVGSAAVPIATWTIGPYSRRILNFNLRVWPIAPYNPYLVYYYWWRWSPGVPPWWTYWWWRYPYAIGPFWWNGYWHPLAYKHHFKSVVRSTDNVTYSLSLVGAAGCIGPAASVPVQVDPNSNADDQTFSSTVANCDGIAHGGLNIAYEYDELGAVDLEANDWV